MKQPLKILSQQYVAALRRHLQHGTQASLKPALKLGGRAMHLGLEESDVELMHAQAIAALKLVDRTHRTTRQAGSFLIKALAPILKRHHSLRRRKPVRDRQDTALDQGGAKMAALNLQLKRRVVRHKDVEASLRKCGEQCTKLLKGALPKREGLRQLAHRILLTQEEERRRLSLKLQDDIAQTLLSINVHLLNLRTAANGNEANLLKKVTLAQQLVEDSIKSINRFARELDAHEPA